MAMIRTLKSFLGKKIYPKTVTKAIYDTNGNRLDVTLENLNKSIEDIDNRLEYNTLDINDEVIINSNMIPYTFSDDGYIMLHTTTSVQIRINQYLCLSSKSSDGSDFFNALNVRKGMKITELTGKGIILYYPLRSNQEV